jgi:hydrogenase expression/formation protein HypD
MTLKHTQEYRDPAIARPLVEAIRAHSHKAVNLMEVCGTHTMSIFRHGLRSLLPETVHLLSGPGCPVCVTAQQEIDAFIAIAALEDTIVATFGDLLRVPGTVSSLQKQRAEGSDIRTVYSAFDALALAEQTPDKKVVFLGVGFETTAPTIAATVLTAHQKGVDNFMVYSAHKLVPPALEALMQVEGVRIDGFLLPGHVSVILGLDGYRPFIAQHPIPAVVAGFEPADLLQGIAMLVEQIEAGQAELANAYPRAVSDAGNPKARLLLKQVFDTVDTRWRGIGTIAASGLKFKSAFDTFDAEKRLDYELPASQNPKGCLCGQILTGLIAPPQCPLFRKACTPMEPVGPCMVSSEGTCAAYYRFHDAS